MSVTPACVSESCFVSHLVASTHRGMKVRARDAIHNSQVGIQTTIQKTSPWFQTFWGKTFALSGFHFDFK